MSSPPARPRAFRRRAPRASLACETCRIRKTKCDQSQPCSYCAYHALDCVYRTAAANEGLSRAGNRYVRSRGSQRDMASTRPSPWPKLNQNIPEGRTERHETQSHPPSERSNSPSLFPGDTRIRQPSDTAINPRIPEVGRREEDRNTSNADTSEPYDSASRDGLSGVNLHTNSTEFYGNSSNLAFLGNLYAGPRNQADNTPRKPGNMFSTSTTNTHAEGRPGFRGDSVGLSPEGLESRNIRSGSDRTHPSIVNLLYNPDYSRPDSMSHGQTQNDRGRELGINGPGELPQNTVNDRRAGISSAIAQLSTEAQLEIEKMFITSYFSNKHYIHPMLCKRAFMVRCEQEAWNISRRPWFSRGHSKFAGLYFAVIALGAINATPNETSLLDHYCTYSPDPRSGGGRGYSTLDFADFYFGVTKQALGDIFESSSIESTQALLLMCAFCQDALRPHSCFMYSGMAVRTAMAIGIASGMSSLPAHMRKEGKRTWWAIYSHEVEMCVSSGRMDSVKELHYYKAPLPTLKANCPNLNDPEAEEDVVGIIPVMVSLSHIMFEASHQLYHSANCSIAEMSRIAMTFDQRTLTWKANLPKFLDLDAPSLNDPEWAFKQKFVLKLRFYNARILIHRPFLVASTSTSTSTNETNPGIFNQHIRACLSAARASIQMQYDSFLHKLYVRTWWYNTTYALYATMILLHLILSNIPIPDDEADLITDIEKSLDIFSSMNNLFVARRCAEMIREVLDVARTCLARRRRGLSNANAAAAAVNNSGNVFAGHDPAAQTPISPFNFGQDSTGAGAIGGWSDGTGFGAMCGVDADFLSSLFAGQDSESAADGSGDGEESTRAGVLANLVDPGVLEDFAFGGAGSDYSIFWGS